MIFNASLIFDGSVWGRGGSLMPTLTGSSDWIERRCGNKK